LEYNFPHYSRPKEQITSYAKCLVAMMKRLKQLRPKILELLVERCLAIDVAIQTEAVNLPTEEVEAEDELEVIDSDLLRRSSSPVALNMVDLMAKLDALLCLLFSYIREESEAELEACFEVMLQLFDRHILPTFRSRSTPFLLFYLSSRAPALTDLFLGFLMKRIYQVFDDPTDRRRKASAVTSTASLLTVVTASYIGSFVARARFLPTELVRLTFDMLLTWSLRFVGDLPSHLKGSALKQSGVAKNSQGGMSERVAVFYAVVQTIMYIFCFRHRILLCNSADAAPTDSTQRYRTYLLPILQSALNPLRWCSRAVIEEFARLADQYDLVDCRALTERDSRRSVPGVRELADDDLITAFSASSSAAFGSLLGDLDCYFPFDPLILRDAAAFIGPDIFIDWSETNDLASSSEEEEDECTEDEGEGEAEEADDDGEVEDEAGEEPVKKRHKAEGSHRARELLACNPVWQPNHP
jgi:RNA polymerase I-specific transcription initiation factor RRN3